MMVELEMHLVNEIPIGLPKFKFEHFAVDGGFVFETTSMHS